MTNLKNQMSLIEAQQLDSATGDIKGLDRLCNNLGISLANRRRIKNNNRMPHNKWHIVRRHVTNDSDEDNPSRYYYEDETIIIFIDSNQMIDYLSKFYGINPLILDLQIGVKHDIKFEHIPLRDWSNAIKFKEELNRDLNVAKKQCDSKICEKIKEHYHNAIKTLSSISMDNNENLYLIYGDLLDEPVASETVKLYFTSILEQCKNSGVYTYGTLIPGINDILYNNVDNSYIIKYNRSTSNMDNSDSEEMYDD